MKLEACKAAIESEEAKRAEAQGQTIKKLRAAVKKRNADIQSLLRDKMHLMYQCRFVSWTSTFRYCSYCEFRRECGGWLNLKG